MAAVDADSDVAWSVDDVSVTNTNVIAYYLQVTTGGASGVAEITVTSDTAGEGNAAVVVTTAMAFTIGASRPSPATWSRASAG